jgi:hypothetical protein
MWRAREPLRKAGTPSDRGPNHQRASDGAMPAGALLLDRRSRTPPPLAGSVTERSFAGQPGGLRFSRQRNDARADRRHPFPTSFRPRWHGHLACVRFN